MRVSNDGDDRDVAKALCSCEAGRCSKSLVCLEKGSGRGLLFHSPQLHLEMADILIISYIQLFSIMDSIFDYISPKIYIVCLSFGQCVVFPRFMDILPILSYPPVFCDTNSIYPRIPSGKIMGCPWISPTSDQLLGMGRDWAPRK